MSERRANRHFTIAVALLLLYLGIVQVVVALGETATGDEPGELAAGYTYLKTGDFRLNPEHPPLVKILAALPLLRFGIHWPSDPALWESADQYGFGLKFLRENSRKSDAMLFAGRMQAVLFSLCLGLVMAVWTKRTFGPVAALIALSFYVFDPTVTAYGHYLKNDIAVAFFAFLTCLAWDGFLRRPSVTRLLAAGCALGLAQATKFSALFLLPVLPILYLIHLWQNPKTLRVWQGFLSLLIAACLAAAVVHLTYAIPAALHHKDLGGVDGPLLQTLFDRAGAHTRTQVPQPHVSGYPYFDGLIRFLDHGTTGHRAYLLGEFRDKGWWYYFPVAFLIKMPAATLALLALAAFAGVRRFPVRELRSISPHWFALAVPVIVFGLFSLASRINIGIRHILPLWPFLFVLAASILIRARLRYGSAILASLTALLVAESVSTYPHYTAFFNVLAGGPAHGPAILADSNIDWGQDGKGLRDYLKSHPVRKLCLDFWGPADLDRYGIRGPGLHEYLNANFAKTPDCVAAVSVNFLYGNTPDRGDFGWLRELTPIARVGYTIYVYDFNLPVNAKGSVGATTLPKPVFRGVSHQDFHGVPTSSDPAEPGEILIFYLSGLGPVDPPVPARTPAPTSPLSKTRYPVLCRWSAPSATRVAEVLFSGLAPGLIDTYQINVRVPAGLASGELTCLSTFGPYGRSDSTSIVVPVAAK